MLRNFLSLLFAVLCTATLFAQAERYDPYATVKEDPPISADGKINWPPFFKDAAKESRFQGYFATGSCVGTNMRIVDMLKANKVDVNALPQTSVTTQSVLVEHGTI